MTAPGVPSPQEELTESWTEAQIRAAARELWRVSDNVGIYWIDGLLDALRRDPPADSGSSPAVVSGHNIENPPADGCFNCGKPMSEHDSLAHCWPDADVADFLARDREQRAAATHEFVASGQFGIVCRLCPYVEYHPIHWATPEETTP